MGKALRRHPSRRSRRGAGHMVDPSPDADRGAADLRDMAHGDDWPPAARRTGRERAGPPAELPHGTDEPVQPLDLLEHELPRRTPHVPHGPLPRAAAAARFDQGRSARAEPLDPRRLPRDDRRHDPPDAGTGPLPEERAAARRAALPRGISRARHRTALWGNVWPTG